VVKKDKLDFDQPMTRELIDRLLDKEMELEKQPEERALALNYMTQMVEQGYTITDDPAKRYTIGEIRDMTYAYLDGYHDAVKTLEVSLKKMFGDVDNQLPLE
jgi:hypothetical protein